jgi:hypothetical protein
MSVFDARERADWQVLWHGVVMENKPFIHAGLGV